MAVLKGKEGKYSIKSSINLTQFDRILRIKQQGKINYMRFIKYNHEKIYNIRCNEAQHGQLTENNN